MTQQEMKACLEFEEGRYLCGQEHPLYRKKSEEAICEIDLLIHATHNKACQVSKMYNGSHWIQLTKPHQWTFAVRGKQILNAVCNQTTTSHYRRFRYLGNES